MSDPRATGWEELDPALDAELGAWMRHVAPAHAPADLLATALARTRSMPRPRPWRRSLDRLVEGWPASMRLALVVLVIASLAAGAIGVGSRLLPAPRPAPSLPAIPRFVPAGVIEPSGGLTLGDVVAGGPGLIAMEAPAFAPSGARAWASKDGATWTPVAPTATVPIIGGIYGSRTGLVALGLDCRSGSPRLTDSCTLGTGSLASGSWEWQRVQWRAAQASVGTPLFGTGPGAAGYDFQVSATVAGGPGYVSVGFAGTIAGYQFGQVVGAAVATSTDGSTWTFRILFDSAPSIGGLDASSMSSVAALGDIVVAVGSGRSLEPAVWVSSDASSWDRVPAPGAPAQGELDWVVAGPGGFVAVGRDGSSAAAWTSADGRTWQRSPTSPVLADARMTRVLWTGSELLAVGQAGAGDGAAWASADGTSWERLDTAGIFKGIPIVAGVALGSRLVLLGQDPAGQVIVAISRR